MFSIFAVMYCNEIITFLWAHFYSGEFGLIFISTCSPEKTFSHCGCQCKESCHTSSMLLRLKLFNSM